MNKCDVLKRKLENGVRFGEWVTSYEKSRKDGERKESRENEATAVGRCKLSLLCMCTFVIVSYLCS